MCWAGIRCRDGSVSEKVDIFAFGVVLLELISGKDDVDGKSFKECIAFLGGKTTEDGCFDGLRSFMDPCLKEDYPLAEALRLAVLAVLKKTLYKGHLWMIS